MCYISPRCTCALYIPPLIFKGSIPGRVLVTLTLRVANVIVTLTLRVANVIVTLTLRVANVIVTLTLRVANVIDFLTEGFQKVYFFYSTCI